MSVGLPPSMHVFVRDWLSANHVVLRSPEGHVVVDTGYVAHAAMTEALLASPLGLGGEPLAKIVNTHCHSDHVGGNARLRARYGCPIALPEGEGPAVRAWDQMALLLDYAGQRCDRFDWDELLRAGETYVWGELEWKAIGVPGHDMGALAFFNPEHGILISGDALWEHGFGFVMPPEFDPACLPATRATLDRLATLPVRTVIPGHGVPFHGFAHALERAYRRLESFEADSHRLARHAVKVVFTFSLLDRRRVPTASVPGILGTVRIYRDFNDAFFRLSPDDYAAWLIDELTKSGAVARDGDHLVPSTHRTAAG